MAYTTVTGTIFAPNGSPCEGAIVTANFAPASGRTPSLIGTSVFQTVVTAVCDEDGVFTMSLPKNSDITPSGSTWNFSVSENALGFSVTGVTINGTSQDLSSTLNATSTNIVENVAVLKRVVTLTNTQIKALPTTAIELVPAPGANKYILPVLVTATIDHAAGFYTNMDADGYIGIGTDAVDLLYPAFNESGGQTFLDSFLGDSLPTIKTVALSAANQFFVSGWGIVSSGVNQTHIVNKALIVYADNGSTGAFTGGNAANTLKVTVIYTIVDVS